MTSFPLDPASYDNTLDCSIDYRNSLNSYGIELILMTYRSSNYISIDMHVIEWETFELNYAKGFARAQKKNRSEEAVHDLLIKVEQYSVS